MRNSHNRAIIKTRSNTGVIYTYYPRTYNQKKGLLLFQYGAMCRTWARIFLRPAEIPDIQRRINTMADF